MTNSLGDILVYTSPAYEKIWGQSGRSLYQDPGREQRLGKIEVRVSETDGYIDIEIADNGEGVAERLDLFEPLVTSKDDGLGLGLAMSRTLARSYGGDLFLTDRGRGNTDETDDGSRPRFVLRLACM